LCMMGTCQGQPMPCDDANPCTLDVCTPCQEPGCRQPAACVHLPVGTPCDDGDPCTLGDMCVGGQCASGVPECDDGIPCTLDSCSPEDVCHHEPRHEMCAAAEQCAQSSCDPLLGCVLLPKTGPCNDDDPCTINDQCQTGICSGSPLACPEGAVCYGGTCLACVEGSSFCDDDVLVTCKGGESVSFDCATEAQVCIEGPAPGQAECTVASASERIDTVGDAAPASPDVQEKTLQRGGSGCQPHALDLSGSSLGLFLLLIGLLSSVAIARRILP